MKTITSPVPEPDFAAFLAIDWADELHAFCLCPSGSSQVESGTVRHDPQSLHPWLEELGRRFAGKLTVQAVVPASGRAGIQQVFVDGKPYAGAMKDSAARH
jgi:hypothetical protein